MSFILTALLLFLFWLILSGRFDLTLLLSAIVASLMVSYMCHGFLMEILNIRIDVKRIIRFFNYLMWLLYQIILANLDLVRRTLHPAMPINPRIVKFKINLNTEQGIVIFANSITLTPGTITIEANKNEFIVHAIDEDIANNLVSGKMLQKIKKIEETNYTNAL